MISNNNNSNNNKTVPPKFTKVKEYILQKYLTYLLAYKCFSQTDFSSLFLCCID